MTARAGALWLAAVLWLAAIPAQAASPFAEWAAVVVAGDWRAHDGGPSEGFDNARRDVSQALVRAGFQPANLKQFSVRPKRYKERPERADISAIYHGLAEVAGHARGGCLFYASSHGAPEGLVVGEDLLAPGVLGHMLDEACGPRPTVVVLSACFSGVFIPALAGSNRMVLTAARPDRTSFGCGQDDKYPYFDDCFLSVFPRTEDFRALAQATRACVAAREVREKANPPSEPQLFIGAGLRPLLPLFRFDAQPAAPAL